MTKITCMFCNQIEESSEEHIIPSSLGNDTLKTNLVCKKCNNELGSKVDAKFLNNQIVAMYRNKYNLKGKKGAVPLDLKEGFDKQGNKYSRSPKDGRYEVIPQNEIKNGKFSILASSEKNAETILNKMVKRKHIDIDIDEVMKGSKKEEVRELNFTFEIMINEYLCEYLKIAYEIMMTKFSDYKNDITGKNIKKILNSIIDGKKAQKDLPIGMYVSGIATKPSILSEISKYEEKLGEKYHLVYGYVDEDGKYYLNIFLLEGNLSARVMVSEDPSGYSEIQELIPIQNK